MRFELWTMKHLLKMQSHAASKMTEQETVEPNQTEKKVTDPQWNKFDDLNCDFCIFNMFT